MISNKRGAIELSITTIVVVVIGVTLLTLGLIWVNNIFDRLGATTGGAFEKVDTQISEILGQGSGSWLSVSPSSISLKKGEDARVKIVIENVERQNPTDITVKVDGSYDTSQNVECKFLDSTTAQGDSQRYTVESGFQASLTVIVKDSGATLGTKSCLFKLVGEGGTTLTNEAKVPVTLLINVVS